jgi:hypothetical protein
MKMNEGKTRLGKFDKWGYSNMFSKKELARELVYTNEDNYNLQQEIERLNNIIKNIDKMFEYYFLGNLKYDQDTVNTIYVKYIKLKELKGSDK